MSASGESGLIAFFGERDRYHGRLVADRVVDEIAAAGLEAAALMRGVEGFGAKHLRRTDRLLTLSEDLPIVVSGVGDAEAVKRAAAGIGEMVVEAPVTSRDVSIFGSTDLLDPDRDLRAAEWVRATIYLGRGRRIDGMPAYAAVVTRLRSAGVEGATVLLGVDGLLGGGRQRAGFFSRNVDVPAQIVSVGSAEAIARGLVSLRTLPGERVVALEETHVCKSAGSDLRLDAALPRRDDLIKLTLFSSEQAQVGGRPVHVEAVRAMRAAGAVGATSMRGVWGFDGGHAPHGDSLRRLRRWVPTVTVVVDSPAASKRWLEVLDELTPSRGLITSERLSPAAAGR